MRTQKVVWSEGLFLRPQLFQQQERYLEFYAHQRAVTITPFFWGFAAYEIDREALSYGKLVLRSGKGVLPDGTPFEIPGHASPPEPLTITPEHLGKMLWLAVPLRLDNSNETIFEHRDLRFMVIGAPKSGKTSIVFSSDQAFPLPEQLNRKDRENPPTGQCECLFTNDALFFDTSGKYVTRGDDLAQHEWIAILHALKKTRPVKAINGVILVLSAQDILHKDQGEQLSLASELRASLDELRQHLGIRFPVYVTVTKLDLLTGFEEYFRNLTASEREKMWGVTFPYGKEEGAVPDDLHERITQAFLKLEDRLHKAMYVRQQEEYDVNDRKKMYSLPQDFRVLAVNTAGIVNNIFFASRYDETQFHSTLRGIYFLSNCQPGHSELVNNSTLLHKWHNLIHQKQPQTPASVREKPNEEDVIAGSAWGKHYFLSRLFSDVIVADRDLVSYNMRLHSQYWLKNVAGHLAALAIMVWLLSAFTKSFHLNQEYLHVVKNKIDVLGSQVTEFVENPGKPLLPGVLNASRNVAQYDELNLPDPALPWRYGLYTGGAMLEGAQKLYYFFLKQSLLPQLQDEAGKKLRDAIDKNDADAVWQSLKLYLMLAGEGKTDNSYLIKEIIHQWESSGAITPYGERAVFVTHLNALFSLPEWRQNARPLNDDWVKQARALLGECPDTMRVWHRLKSELLADSSKKLTLRGLTGGQSPMIFTLNDEVLKRQGIAHIYTRDGWQDQVKKKLVTRLTDLQDEDRWVMGNAKGTTTNPLTMREGVMTLYLKEYTSVWQHFLGNIRLVPMGKTKAGGVGIDIALLRTLVGDNSPLRALLQRVVDETTLAGKETRKLTDGLSGGRLLQGQLVQQTRKLQQNLDFRDKSLIREYLDSKFAGIRYFVRGETETSTGKGEQDFAQGQSAPMYRVMGLLNDQYTRMVVYNSSLGNGEIPSIGSEGDRLAAEAETWPEPAKSILRPLLVRSSRNIKNQIISVNLQAIRQGPGEICYQLIHGRYPFAESERNVALRDFVHFFAGGGVADSWFNQHLAAQVDTSAHPWRFKGSHQSEGLAFFEQAAAIRTQFFADEEGKRLALNFLASVRYLSPSVNQLLLKIGDRQLRYAHGPVIATDLNWYAGGKASIITISTQKPGVSAMPERVWRGPWALFRWLDAAQESNVVDENTSVYSWSFAGTRMEIAISGLGDSGYNMLQLLRNFRCPPLSVKQSI